MIKLIERLRSIRDESLNSVTCNDTPCEVIFTYLESLTTNNRDISLDYKLPGPLLSNTLPNVQTRATFNNVEKSLRPNVTCGKGNVLIPKTSCSVFTSTNINYVLKNLNIEQLVICGQLTDQCVFSAVRDAADLGYFVSVVEEACAALSEIDHRRGIAGMEGFARIVTTNDILNELYKSNHTVPGIQQDSFHNLSSEMNPSLKQLPSSSQITPTSAIKKHISLIKDWRPLPCTNYCIEPLLHTLHCNMPISDFCAFQPLISQIQSVQKQSLLKIYYESSSRTIYHVPSIYKIKPPLQKSALEDCHHMRTSWYLNRIWTPGRFLLCDQIYLVSRFCHTHLLLRWYLVHYTNGN